jgi:hypothetical protein
MQLRALLPEIGVPSIPSILALPKVQDLFDEQSQPRVDWVARQAGCFLDELGWYARARRRPAQAVCRTDRPATGTDVK